VKSYLKAVQSTRPDNQYKELLLACAISAKRTGNNFGVKDVERVSNLTPNTIDRLLNELCSLRRDTLTQRKDGVRHVYSFRDLKLIDYVLKLSKIGSGETAT
jgi:hypothetical protein